jgi:hypothetical protein
MADLIGRGGGITDDLFIGTCKAGEPAELHDVAIVIVNFCIVNSVSKGMDKQ